ncbi:hypothetical protein [Streptomyces sp. NPDC086023]|uniref:hypothetical protein n=1 Tax=Streptomyces sp. NPDC086023 TaxID=3365746 RepID=UPI0037D8F4D0
MSAFRSVSLVRRSLAVAAVVGAAVAGAGGCGAGDRDAAMSPSPSATSGGTPSPDDSRPSSAAPSAVPSTGASDTPSASPAKAAERLVSVTRTGGFAGVHESVLVKEDGAYQRLASAKPTDGGRMTPAALARLRAALAAADFPRQERVQFPEEPVRDGFTYQIVHGGYEIGAADPLSPSLARVIEALPPFS